MVEKKEVLCFSINLNLKADVFPLMFIYSHRVAAGGWFVSLIK